MSKAKLWICVAGLACVVAAQQADIYFNKLVMEEFITRQQCTDFIAEQILAGELAFGPENTYGGEETK